MSQDLDWATQSKLVLSTTATETGWTIGFEAVSCWSDAYSTAIDRVILIGYKFPLLGTKVTENFAVSVSYESWMLQASCLWCGEFIWWSTVSESVWYSMDDIEMHISLMIDYVILIASTAACSSSLGMLRMLVGAMRLFAITKSRCILPWQVVLRWATAPNARRDESEKTIRWNLQSASSSSLDRKQKRRKERWV